LLAEQFLNFILLSNVMPADACHALHCGNAGNELTCLNNLKEHVDVMSLPILPHLLGIQSVRSFHAKLYEDM
jgi:hypothetical protein